MDNQAPIMTIAECDAAIAATPAPRVTKDQMAARINRTNYFRLTETLTVCVIELDSGFTVTGESACASPENYRQDIGEKIAYDNAFEKLWPLFGFLLKQQLHTSSSTSPSGLALNVQTMVDAFLSWHLPDDFSPDDGITFEPFGNKGTAHEYRRQPTGTNLLSSSDARVMVCHMLEAAGIPAF